MAAAKRWTRERIEAHEQKIGALVEALADRVRELEDALELERDEVRDRDATIAELERQLRELENDD